MKTILVCLFMSFSLTLFAQTATDYQLANYYMEAEDFSKALPYCEKIFQKEGSKANFDRLLICLVKTNDFKASEKLIKKQLDKTPNDADLMFELANVYSKNNNEKGAKKIYEGLINDLPDNGSAVISLYKLFKINQKNEYAKETLDKGRRKLKNTYPLHYYFADYYFTEGKTNEGIEEYLGLLKINSETKEMIQTDLGARIDWNQEDHPIALELKDGLISQSQKHPNDIVYGEMLIWLFCQKRNFDAAVTQAIGINKRINGTGKIVYDLGQTCIQNKAFPEARRAFKEILSFGEASPYEQQAEFSLLNTRFVEVTTKRNYSQEELNSTIQDYKTTLAKRGYNASTVSIQLELAQIQTFYANQSAETIKMLSDGITKNSFSGNNLALVKIALGDAYVVADDIWEASLLYQQVDKDFKFDVIGYEAKFKNARIFYYDGDFKWAQTQLDILKESTSKLISNDAMNLSILITDNLGLDSNFTAMYQFAQADLLVQQRRYKEASFKLDSITKFFPAHGLMDEVLMKRADAEMQQGEWAKACEHLERIVEFYGKDILADNALFLLGDIYQNQFNDNEKASIYYKKIMFEHTGSLFVVEARKRFRTIRGDKVDDL
jgi:tetratricopeptide (TPR) repeat protein